MSTDTHPIFATPSPDEFPSVLPSSDSLWGPSTIPDMSDQIPGTSHAAEKTPSVPVDIDQDYYLESVFVVFQVENRLFRVPTYLLAKESQFFEGMFGLPQPQADDVEGSSPNKPIIMPPEYKREDFRNLMKALYPSSVSLTLSLSKTEWISILKLSTKWYFISLRKMGISELERMSVLTDIDRITLGRQCFVSSWLISGFEGMVQREDTITDDEIAEIGYTTAVELFRIRELRLKGMMRYPYHTSPTEKIEEAFIVEISSMRSDENAFIQSEKKDSPLSEKNKDKDNM